MSLLWASLLNQSSSKSLLSICSSLTSPPTGAHYRWNFGGNETPKARSDEQMTRCDIPVLLLSGLLANDTLRIGVEDTVPAGVCVKTNTICLRRMESRDLLAESKPQ